MIVVTIAVKDGGHLRGETLEFDELGPDELDQVHELSQTLVDYCERIARVHAARAKDRPL